MRVWQCLSPNVGPFHIYPKQPGTIACDPAYHAHQKCGPMELVSTEALIVEKVNDMWPEWVDEAATHINASYSIMTSGRFSIPVPAVLDVLWFAMPRQQ